MARVRTHTAGQLVDLPCCRFVDLPDLFQPAYEDTDKHEGEDRDMIGLVLKLHRSLSHRQALLRRTKNASMIDQFRRRSDRFVARDQGLARGRKLGAPLVLIR
jgi:hypothetical protein